MKIIAWILLIIALIGAVSVIVFVLLFLMNTFFMDTGRLPRIIVAILGILISAPLISRVVVVMKDTIKGIKN
jgi:hypothetical protein